VILFRDCFGPLPVADSGGMVTRPSRGGDTMTQDVPALPEVPDGRRYRAWDGSVWSDRDSRDVHNHTHPAGGVPGFAPVSWNDDELWGSIDARR
jgi:hypothetical protein